MGGEITMTRRDAGEKTFVKVTNADIYREVQELKKIQQEQHQAVTKRLDVTNGKVKKSLWLATTAMTFIILLLTMFVQHLSKG